MKGPEVRGVELHSPTKDQRTLNSTTPQQL